MGRLREMKGKCWKLLKNWITCSSYFWHCPSLYFFLPKIQMEPKSNPKNMHMHTHKHSKTDGTRSEHCQDLIKRMNKGMNIFYSCCVRAFLRWTISKICEDWQGNELFSFVESISGLHFLKVVKRYARCTRLQLNQLSILSVFTKANMTSWFNWPTGDVTNWLV